MLLEPSILTNGVYSSLEEKTTFDFFIHHVCFQIHCQLHSFFSTRSSAIISPIVGENLKAKLCTLHFSIATLWENLIILVNKLLLLMESFSKCNPCLGTSSTPLTTYKNIFNDTHKVLCL